MTGHILQLSDREVLYSQVELEVWIAAHGLIEYDICHVAFIKSPLYMNVRDF